MDVGQTMTVNATFVANGMDWNLSDSYVRVMPLTGLNCTRAVPTTVTASVAAIYGTCVASAPGTYLVRVGSGNSMGYALNSSVEVRVFAAPSAAAPTVSVAGIGLVASADVGQAVTITASLTGGTGALASVIWNGLPANGCGPTNSTAITCTLTQAGVLGLSYSATDSNRVRSGVSPTLSFPVYSLPVGLPVEANRTSADVNQVVEFTAGLSPGTGAPGPATIQWSGLPAGCLPLGANSESCRPNQAAVSAVRFSAVDANGGVANESPPRSFQVYADPIVAIYSSGVPDGMVGATLELNTSVSGGSGGDTFSWSGLPTGCQSANATLACEPQEGGVFQVGVTVEDSNGFQARSGTVTLTVSNASSQAPVPSGGLATWEYIGIGGGAVVVVLAVVLAVRRRPPQTAEDPGSETG